MKPMNQRSKEIFNRAGFGKPPRPPGKPPKKFGGDPKKERISREVEAIALSLMAGLACPRSLTVAILLKYGEYEQLANLAVVPSHYQHAETYWSAAQATAFLKKFVDLPGLPDPEVKTAEKWAEAEKSCYRTNQRLFPFIYNTFSDEDEPLLEFFSDVRKVVREILGDSPPEGWESEARFGPGATMSDTSRLTTVPDKMSSVPTLTPNAWPFLFPWMGTWWYAAQAKLGQSVKIVRGNSYFSVPKTAVVKRACAKECSLPVFYQLGLGRVMKRCLRTWGLDLKEGKEVHMRVACTASITQEFATIDLTSASDTLCYALVKLVLPPKWFEVLDALRAPATLLGSKKYQVLEKFSSMGNGFTFELETVIFAAITMAASKRDLIPGHNLFVYGDDIIVPTEKAKEVISALKFCGFSTNKDKTFVDGPFRESCGGDYFNGVGVRPFYLEDDCHEPQHYVTIANGIRRAANQCSGWYRTDQVRNSWFKALDFIPEPIRNLRGPEVLGDIVIHDSSDRWVTRWRDSIRYVKVYKPAVFKRVRWDGFAYDVQFAAALYGVQRTNFNPKDQTREGDLIPRDGVAGYRVGWVPFS